MTSSISLINFKTSLIIGRHFNVSKKVLIQLGTINLDYPDGANNL